MSDKEIKWKLDVDDAQAQVKFKLAAAEAKKAAQEQVARNKEEAAASRDRIDALERELAAAKRFYAEQKRMAREAAEEKEKLIEREFELGGKVQNARKNVEWRGNAADRAALAKSEARLEEHRGVMREAIPELDSSPESVKAAADEVENLKQQIVEQKMALRDATAESKKYEAAAKKIAEAQDEASSATEAGRSIIYGYYQAQNAVARAMRGDFAGAALSASRGAKSIKEGFSNLKDVLDTSPWILFAAAAGTAIAFVINGLREASELKKQMLASANAQWHVSLTIGDEREERENPYSKKLEAMSESNLAKELNDKKKVYEWRKNKTIQVMGELGRATSEEGRKQKQAELDEMLRLEDEDFKRIQQVEAEIERKKMDRERGAQDAVNRRQKARDEQNRVDSERQAGRFAGKRDRRALEREEELLGIDDPIARLEKQREFLWHDRRVAAQSDDPYAESKTVAIDREILMVNQAISDEKEKQERLAADALRSYQDEQRTLKDIRNEAELVGLDREAWLKKRIAQVRELYDAETDPVKKASLGLTGKQLSNELAGFSDSSPAAAAPDDRTLSPTGSGVRMNDMSKVSAGGVSMVKQPFGNKVHGPKWGLQSIGGSASLSELMDLGRGQSPLSVDPQAKIARNTEKTNELLDEIRQNLKGVS